MTVGDGGQWVFTISIFFLFFSNERSACGIIISVVCPVSALVSELVLLSFGDRKFVVFVCKIINWTAYTLRLNVNSLMTIA